MYWIVSYWTGFFSVHTFMSLLFLLQVFTCGNSTHLLRRERNVVTVMPCFMSDTLSSNTRRPTRMRSVSSVSSVTTAADRCGSSGIGKICALILNYNFKNCLILLSNLGTPHDNAQAYTHWGEAIWVQPVWENIPAEAASGHALQALPWSQLCPHCLRLQQV